MWKEIKAIASDAKNDYQDSLKSLDNRLCAHGSMGKIIKDLDGYSDPALKSIWEKLSSVHKTNMCELTSDRERVEKQQREAWFAYERSLKKSENMQEASRNRIIAELGMLQHIVDALGMEEELW